MSDLLEEISALRRDADRARAEQARREALADQAEGIYTEAIGKLRELGFETPEAALQESARIREELSGKVSEVQEQLRKAARQ